MTIHTKDELMAMDKEALVDMILAANPAAEAEAPAEAAAAE